MTGKVHLIGICGSGLSAIAKWLHHIGWEVSGCDRNPGITGISLQKDGIEIKTGHSPLHLKGVDLIVFSAAVPDDNPELMFARKTGKKVLRKSEILAELSRDAMVIAVSGAHGKTTTCAMLGWALQEMGADPTVFVGGSVSEWNGGFRGGGDIIVMEADEYDRAFLRIKPSYAAVTSYAEEHLECYGDAEALSQAYSIFLELTLPGGSVVVPESHRMLAVWAERLGRKIITTGRGGDFYFKPDGSEKWGEKFVTGKIHGSIAIPGVHNLSNASTAVAILTEMNFPLTESIKAVGNFRGVSRRLERIGTLSDGRVIVSDYAHHPDEITASIEAVKRCRSGKLGVVFEPHLYSRTARLAEEMGEALAAADWVAVIPVFPAREKPLPGVSNALVASAVKRTGSGDCAAVTEDEISVFIDSRESDTVIFMGAGRVDSLARKYLEYSFSTDIPDSSSAGIRQIERS